MKISQMMLIAAVLLAGWLVSVNVLPAQPEGDSLPEDARHIPGQIDGFLRAVGSGERTALDDLLQRSPLRSNSRRIGDLRDSIRKEIPRYGEFMGSEPLRIVRLGRSLIRCIYLYRGEEYPIVWRFTYYRPEETGEWLLIGLKFDVDYDDLPASS